MNSHMLIFRGAKIYFRGARTYSNNLGVRAITKVGNHCSIVMHH